MTEIRGITVSVGYAEVLRITLARNMRHMKECLVVTSPGDHATQEVACSVPGVSVFETTAFYYGGAKFNKGYSLELGFLHMGKHGWVLIHDADILFPESIPWGLMKPNCLHGCRRRVLEDPSKWHEGLDWRTCPVSRDGGPIGYWQLAHADDPALRGKPYWYDPTFAHAGGGDAFFMEHWSPANRVILPFDVLHLGPIDTHWFGVDQAGKDMMAAFVHRNGWHRAMKQHSLDAVKRAGPIVERVDVPGYPKSTYELPFARRAQRLRDQKR